MKAVRASALSVAMGLTIMLTVALDAYAQRAAGTTVVLEDPSELFLTTDLVIERLVEEIDSTQIISSLLRLEAFRTRHSSTDSIVAARDWLVSEFTRFGYTDIVLHPFTWSGRSLHNIVVTKPGTLYPNKYVLLIGHYDSISETPTTLAPGVNDNGSGIALILEVARILASKQLDYSIRFICFSAEEQGLVGSTAYVQTVVVPQNHDIKLVINVDQIGGYSGWANTNVKVERDENNNPPGNNEPSARYTDTLATLTRTYSSLSTSITNAFGSDYMPFQSAGYVITGYYEHTATPHYHRNTDNFANVDPQYIYQITRGALAGMAYFGDIKRAFISVHHNPLKDTQDTSQAASVTARVLTSGPVTEARMTYFINDLPDRHTTPLTFLGMSGDTLRYGGTIPKQPYYTTVKYFLVFSNTDSVVTSMPADTLTPLSFMFVPDTIPPVIAHTSLPNLSHLDAPFEISASVTDANGIDSVVCVYRVNGGTGYHTVLQQSSPVLWNGTIVATVSAGDNVEYYIYSVDQSFNANVGRQPEQGWYTFRILSSMLFDFEGDDGGFQENGEWEWGTIGTSDIPPPTAGTKMWGTNLAGNYSNNLTSLLVTPEFDLTDKMDVVLTFKHFYKIEPNNDGGQVRVVVDNGKPQLLAPEGGYPTAFVAALGGPGFSGNSFVWRQPRFLLPPLTNQQVRFHFVFSSDILTTNRGWYVDDVRLDFLDTTSTGVVTSGWSLPNRSALHQNYPNPFNPTTTIRFDISPSDASAGADATLKVFNLLGQEIATLLAGPRPAGTHTVMWDATGYTSGVYLLQLRIGQFIDSRKLLVLK